MKRRFPLPTVTLYSGLCLLALAAATTPDALAADRVVLAEHFMNGG
jgi:hypothetical protein